jgi:DsbC/DsbD-like thiol-disulfide interchange protein
MVFKDRQDADPTKSWYVHRPLARSGETMKRLFLALAALMFVSTANAQDVNLVVKKIEATVEPKEAKPGQLVTVKIHVELEDGWTVYPTAQTDKGAASFVSKFILPKEGLLLFVGKPVDPSNVLSKAEPALGIEKLLYYTHEATFEHKVIISPKAEAGTGSAKISARLTVCNKDNCLAGKFDLEAKVKISSGPAVEIDAKYKDEVEKLLKK